MSKVLICYRVNEHSVKLSGVFQKFLGQVKGFLSAGHEVYGAYMSYDALHLVHFNSASDVELVAASAGISIKDERQLFWKKLEASLAQVDLKFDMAYFRYDPMYNGDAFSDFLGYCQSQQVKVVVEFPTYPYAQEVKDQQALEVDFKHRKKMHAHIDLLTSTSTAESIDGYPYIRFNNRVDVEAVRLLESFQEHRFNEKKIRLLSIANFSPWHGYDRLIKGISNHVVQYGSCPVELHLVGSGESEQQLKVLVEELNLQDYVIFHGAVVGEALQPYYLHADIGVSSLALHRIGLKDACPLKARGYMCNGLPVAYAYNDQDMQTVPYRLQLVADDSDIELRPLIEFAKHCYQQQHARETIAQYAIESFDWSGYCIQVSNVMKELDG